MRRRRLLGLGAFLGVVLLAAAVPVGAAPPAQGGVPSLPQPAPVAVDPATTAVLVLDLSARCDDPQQVCREIVPAVARFLERARAEGLFILYTVSAGARGTPLGDVWRGFDARPDEPVLYPDAYDKFAEGDLQARLAARGIKTLVMTGSSTNIAIMYTATSAARMHGYDVVIPLDGVNATTPFEHEYALYQLTRLGIAPQFHFTTLDGVSFGGS